MFVYVFNFNQLIESKLIYYNLSCETLSFLKLLKYKKKILQIELEDVNTNGSFFLFTLLN